MSPPGARVAAIGVAALAFALAAAPAFPGHGTGRVVVLRSRALGAYDAAVAGFEASHRGPVTRLSLDDRDLPRCVGALEPDAIVAVGLRAALYARDHFPRTPLVFCAVPEEAARRELSGAWITGVTAEIPPAAEFAAWRKVAPDVRRIAMFHGPGWDAGHARLARQAAESG